MANIYARLGAGDKALECLELLARSCITNNFFSLHNDWRNTGIGLNIPWAPVQLDANMGIAAAVQEMILFSGEGIIKLLPALPKKWEKGEAKNLLCCDGITVSIKWDLELMRLEADITAQKASKVTVIMPEAFGGERIHLSIEENSIKHIYNINTPYIIK